MGFEHSQTKSSPRAPLLAACPWARIGVVFAIGALAVSCGSASAIARALGESHLAAPLPPAGVPTVTEIVPAEGPEAGGTEVTITGTNLTGATEVKFGATNAKSFEVVSATSIKASSPAGTGKVDVTVTTAEGTSATTPADEFTYVPKPTVGSIAPDEGPEAGGTTVTISGTDFTGATEVKFGATKAKSFEVVSATSIKAVSPAGSGKVHVTVTTAGGTSAKTSADEFTFIAAPSVTKVVPDEGPEAGATEVTITGTNFTGATEVRFGATKAKSFEVLSATSIKAVSPAGTGKVDVTVTTAAGTSAKTSADEFTFIARPAVTSVSPDKGPAAGGTTVTITGTGFREGATVSFGAAKATEVKVSSETSITVVSPAGSGTVHVMVTAPGGGTSGETAADAFTYLLAPEVTALSPLEGPESGGTSVTITGTNLTEATAVKFGSTPATSFKVESETTIVATSPAGSGTVHVTVTTSAGTSAESAASAFTYTTPEKPSEGGAPPKEGAPPPPPAAATCTLKPIFLTIERKHKGKAKPKITAGRLEVTVKCTEIASVTLAGRLSVPKHGKQKKKVYILGPSGVNVSKAAAAVVPLKLPLATVVALVAKAKESVRISLTATNPGGVSHNAVSIKQLRA